MTLRNSVLLCIIFIIFFALFCSCNSCWSSKEPLFTSKLIDVEFQRKSVGRIFWLLKFEDGHILSAAVGDVILQIGKTYTVYGQNFDGIYELKPIK